MALSMQVPLQISTDSTQQLCSAISSIILSATVVSNIVSEVFRIFSHAIALMKKLEAVAS